MLIDPGQLCTELALEELVRVPDGQGGYSETWNEIALVFAHLEPVSADSDFAAGRDVQTTSHRITIRHRTPVEPGMRFRKLDRYFRVASVHDPDETGRYLICMTAEDTP